MSAPSSVFLVPDYELLVEAVLEDAVESGAFESEAARASRELALSRVATGESLVAGSPESDALLASLRRAAERVATLSGEVLVDAGAEGCVRGAGDPVTALGDSLARTLPLDAVDLPPSWLPDARRLVASTVFEPVLLVLPGAAA